MQVIVSSTVYLFEQSTFCEFLFPPSGGMANFSVIPNASYFVSSSTPKIYSSIVCAPGSCGCRGRCRIQFYTPSGYALSESRLGISCSSARSCIDPSTDKPKIASYRRIWWPAFRVGFGLTKGVPGYAVLFHDKHGNRIAWCRLNSADEPMHKWTPSPSVDFSSAIEELADFSAKRPPTRLERGCKFLLLVVSWLMTQPRPIIFAVLLLLFILYR
jgi:hypothetical protein